MAGQRRLLAWLEREVRACRPTALRYFRSAGLRVERKRDRSPVTAADRAVEERLRQAIARACPGEPIVGEEFGRSGDPRTDTFWTIDPIDGTRAFSRGLPSWAIMVGRVERGRATLGLCDFPAIGVTIGVAPGVAAYERIGGRPSTTLGAAVLSLSKDGRCRPLARPRLIHAFGDVVLFHGGAGWWARTPYARGFARLIRGCYLERSYGDCYGYLWALRGCVDAVIDYGVKVWDLVPLAALARATGRALIDVSGRPNVSGPDSIFAEPRLARRISRILRADAQ